MTNVSRSEKQLQIQSPPHSKHTPSPLQRPTSSWCSVKMSLFIEDQKKHKHTLCGQNVELFNSATDPTRVTVLF